MTLRTVIHSLCKQIAAETSEWQFSSGKDFGTGSFKRKDIKFADAKICPCFNFKVGTTCNMQWEVVVNHQKLAALCNEIIPWPYWTLSEIGFKGVVPGYKSGDPDKHPVSSIWTPNMYEYYRQQGKSWPRGWILVADCEPYLRKAFADGQALIAQYYDLSSERALLENLPTQKGVVGDAGRGGLEGDFAIMYCLARMSLGDFDFFELYRSEEFETVYPKNTKSLDQLAAKVPELKKRYAKTGSIFA